MIVKETGVNYEIKKVGSVGVTRLSAYVLVLVMLMHMGGKSKLLLDNEIQSRFLRT